MIFFKAAHYGRTLSRPLPAKAGPTWRKLAKERSISLRMLSQRKAAGTGNGGRLTFSLPRAIASAIARGTNVELDQEDAAD